MQCDKYYVCETDGTLVPKLCEVSDKFIGIQCWGRVDLCQYDNSLVQDGLVYDIPGKSCNHPQRFGFMITFIALQIEVQFTSPLIVIKFLHASND